MSRPALTPEQNERVRGYVRELLRQHDNNQTALAPKLGMGQTGVSSLLSGRAGTTYVVAQRVAGLLKLPIWEVLGEPPPRVPSLPPRELAAELVREVGVSGEAIADVLAEPDQGRESWPTLYWTDRMRARHLERLAPPPAPMFPSPKAGEEPEPPSQSGEMRVVRPGKTKAGTAPARRKP